MSKRKALKFEEVWSLRHQNRTNGSKVMTIQNFFILFYALVSCCHFSSCHFPKKKFLLKYTANMKQHCKYDTCWISIRKFFSLLFNQKRVLWIQKNQASLGKLKFFKSDQNFPRFRLPKFSFLTFRSLITRTFLKTSKSFKGQTHSFG